MPSTLVSRRAFLNSSASAIATLAFPRIGFSQTTTSLRLEWQQFKTTPQYSSFVNAVKKMKANTNSSSPSSWEYWSNVHLNYCPHGIPYFMTWHRGMLYYFEQQLRTVSGDSKLSVPYWNYYQYSTIPTEFTDTTPGNPLYMTRTGTNVYNALTMAPFASNVYNFQRGTANAYEPLYESAPHNPVHDLIGGEMANMTSPRDPIFFLHHANTDRLWHAWCLPTGKGMPPTSNPYNAATSNAYWAGSFTYASNLTMPRYKTYYPGWLNFDYSNDTVPTALPPSARADTHGPIRLVQAQVTPLITRPANGNFIATLARTISSTRKALGGLSGVVLNESSVTAQLPLAASNLQTVIDTVSAALHPAARAVTAFQSVIVVLDGLQMLGNGAKGGFYYNVFINLPFSTDATTARKYFLGTIGAFAVNGLAHHGMTSMDFPATEALAQLSAFQLQDVTVSLVRVSGDNAPHGAVLKVGEVRIDVSTAAPWDPSPTPVPGLCYC